MYQVWTVTPVSRFTSRSALSILLSDLPAVRMSAQLIFSFKFLILLSVLHVLSCLECIVGLTLVSTITRWIKRDGSLDASGSACTSDVDRLFFRLRVPVGSQMRCVRARERTNVLPLHLALPLLRQR